MQNAMGDPHGNCLDCHATPKIDDLKVVAHEDLSVDMFTDTPAGYGMYFH